MFYCSPTFLRNLEIIALKLWIMSKSLFERTSWDAMFNMRKVELELISDANMYLFFEKGMRGGVSYISERHSKANNKYLKSYDPKQDSKYIVYLDANNPYGYTISKFLPTNWFK